MKLGLLLTLTDLGVCEGFLFPQKAVCWQKVQRTLLRMIAQSGIVLKHTEAEVREIAKKLHKGDAKEGANEYCVPEIPCPRNSAETKVHSNIT
jgi:hypothetical protein